MRVLPPKKAQSETKTTGTAIHKVSIDKNTLIGTTSGLQKQCNEDRVGYLSIANTQRFCLTDGHWGHKAAEFSIQYWLNDQMIFPHSKLDAIRKTQILEKQLYNQFGKKNMDPTSDFTPESSMLIFEIRQGKVGIVSYGDCRFLIIRKQKIIYEMPKQPTWLGAFSHLSLRNRIPVKKALVYKQVEIQKGDFIFAFSDGIDECIYQTPTLELSFFENSTQVKNPKIIFDSIFDIVFKKGAEDNASLFVTKISY